jgi:hypothetical protein
MPETGRRPWEEEVFRRQARSTRPTVTTDYGPSTDCGCHRAAQFRCVHEFPHLQFQLILAVMPRRRVSYYYDRQIFNYHPQSLADCSCS